MIVGDFVTEEEFYSGLGGQDAVFAIESDEDVLNSALQRSEEEIRAYLTRRYILPDDPSHQSDHLRSLTLQLVKYHMKDLAANHVVGDLEKAAYDTVIRFLDKVRKGDKNSPSVIGLQERRKDGELRVSVPALDSIRQPVQSGRLLGLHPESDTSRIGSLMGNDQRQWLGYFPWE